MSGVITDWKGNELTWQFRRLTGSPETMSVLEMIAESHKSISPEDYELVERYKSGVKVWIFNYNGFLQPHLRNEIERFPGLCSGAGVNYEIQRVSHDYFEDIRNSIVLVDKYSRLFIQGSFEVREYLGMLNDNFYRKHTMVPKMRKLQKK